MSSKKRKEVSSSATPAAPAAKRAKQATPAADPAGGAAPSARRTNVSHAPTVHDIVNDPLTLISLQYWAPGAQEKKPFDAQVVEDIFSNELTPENLNLSRVMLLELSFYLENFLWPNFDPSSSTKAHLLSILLMVNEKFRENVAAFDCFHSAPDGIFTAFWQRVLGLYGELTSMREKTIYIQFMINCFQTLSDPLIRTHCMRLVSLPLWYCLTAGRLQLELERAPKLQRLWKALLKKNQSQQQKSEMDFERDFLPSLIRDYFKILGSIPATGEVDSASVTHCERFVEFMTDLMNQLPTRRFFRAVLEDSHLVVRSRLSALYGRSEGALFRQLLQILRFYENFEINDYTGQALSDEEMLKAHYDQMQRFQAVVFKKFPELKKMALANIGSIDSRQGLTTHLAALKDTARLRELCVELGLVGEKARETAPGAPAWIDHEDNLESSRQFMLEIIISNFERRISQIEALNEKPLYPDETLLWDETVVPSSSTYTGLESIALPKLNLQFLTFHDHLLRNYTLFRLESTYEIRQDVEDVVKRLQPRRNQAGTTSFRGWSRMALPLAAGSSIQNPGFKVTRVGKPRVGEERPSEVIGEIRYTLPTQGYQIRQEWESIRSHDVLFLLFIDAQIPESESADSEDSKKQKLPFPQQYGLKALRGAEVIEVIDESGKVINENDPTAERAGVRRTVRVRLDPAQFHADVLAARSAESSNVDSRLDAEIPPMYRCINAVMRRKAKENNFKAVLETIRELMNARSIIVPDWLRDVMLGYGDPAACTNIEKAQIIDFVDTFLNVDHLKQCFPGKTIKLAPGTAESPFRVKFESETELAIESYTPQPRDFDPTHAVAPKKNSVPFTQTQVEAIQQAMNKGLTLVVGPPGTGKTDVAVQTISNWYHNFPNERILLVTHSNNALNQIFEKIMALDIDERHLVRLGHGERTLETEKDFSRLGRVNHMLQLRLDLLQDVERLAQALQYPPDVAYSCETSANFFHYVVLAEWEKFLGSVKKFAANVPVRDLFPFAKFLTQDELDNAFDGLDSAPLEQQLAAAKTLFQRRIRQRIFDQLEECRPFELLKLQSDRGNYIVTKQARIVAMTCTHAALTRSQLLKLGFKFDNLLMEEAAQILEIETFIPMLLQEQSPEAGSRLKRIVLIGDHNQLPPIVQNMVFQKFGHLDQSLFARLVKLGVPHVTLDSQGRARPGLAELYSWRYKNLKNLPHVSEKREFLLANPGFRYDFQLIDVPDYLGRGEIEPSPYFFQNLGEAEYICAVYMYMRILGYPSEKISIITSYNGQKHLIRDVIRQRCGWNPAIGMPSKITTVDRYQGQQNDYILLSLVRTKTVGHIRDVRRLVVAMSRARLGLYVFCRKDLFKDCYELTPAFSKLLQRPDKLVLVQNEQYGDPNFARDAKADVAAESLLEVADVAHMATIAAPANALGYDHAAAPAHEGSDKPVDNQNDEMQVDPSATNAEESEPAADVRAEDDSDPSEDQ